MHSQPMIAVRDVEKSSEWYQQLLGCQSGHGGQEYEQIVQDGEIKLQLHHWDAHEHPHLGDPENKSRGNGVVLWFVTPDFDGSMQRAREMRATILEGPQVNPLAHHRECWIQDPDGYTVVLSSPHGEIGAPVDGRQD